MKNELSRGILAKICVVLHCGLDGIVEIQKDGGSMAGNSNLHDSAKNKQDEFICNFP